MAYLTVTTVVDVVAPGDGQLSLREALTLANGSGGPDTIRFSATVVGQTLVLTGGELTIGDDVTIDGHNGGAAPQTTIDANKASRVLSITGGDIEATLNGLIISNGRAIDEPGGGIFLGSQASLTLADSVVTDNDTGDGSDSHVADGGGIFADTSARLTVNRSTISNNIVTDYGYYTGADGGGIRAAGNNVVTIADSNITGNTGRFGGGISLGSGGNISLLHTNISDNTASVRGYNGGGLYITGGTANIIYSNIINNGGGFPGGGGISAESSITNVISSNISSNWVGDRYCSSGGGIQSNGFLNIVNSTITGNLADSDYRAGDDNGGGIFSVGKLTISNSVISGNFQRGIEGEIATDIYGTITFSNGHNVFSTDVAGNVPGDRENIAAGAIFAAVDTRTGGGKLGPDGTVALRNNVANPALSAGDPLAASAFDQRGAARPQPAGSLPDLGAVELKQALSTSATANNDVRSGTNAANNLTGLVGNDYLKGLGGNDTLDAGNGSDLLDGGPGNDKLTGGTGVDLVAYPGTAAVIIDLSGTTDTAKRGSETDTLIGIEGALGSSGNDTFKGDALNNAFQGKAGKDIMTGGGGRDTWDFNEVADSPAGATRDVITDFDPSVDVLDLAGIDADSTVPGNQSFRWVAKATLTGAAQLGYFVSGGMTIVRASTDADAAAEVEIQLTGVKVLTANNFRL